MKKMTTKITIAAISLFILSCNKKKAEDSNVTQDSIKTEEKALHQQRLLYLILMPCLYRIKILETFHFSICPKDLCRRINP